MRYFLVCGLRALAMLLSLLTMGCAAEAKEYDVNLVAILKPATGGARVRLEIGQDESLLRQLDFSAPRPLFNDFHTDDGIVERQGERVIWRVPEQGGTLNWHASLNTPKGSAYDARITSNWALLRFEDLLPPTRSVARKGSSSRFKIFLEGPKDWSFETRYGRVGKEPISVESATLNFDRPTGWLIAGKLGVRRETITDRAVTIAAPTGTYFPRIPTLAFLRWTLPHLEEVFPMFPQRLLVVSGTNDMWRGALSGPASLFMHADRPLISENGTSTLLHELVHVATRMQGASGDDWIVEGLAEYYSLEILRRSDGLSEERFTSALEKLQQWAAREKATLADPSKGADTAAAALLFHRIAKELSERAANTNDSDTAISYPLDRVIQHLLSDVGRNTLSRADLQASIRATSGSASIVLIKELEKLKMDAESH